MNNYCCDVANMCNMEVEALVRGGKYTVYSNKVAVIEGHKGIVSLTEQNVTFATKQGKISVTGDNLVLNTVTQGYAVVSGNVTKVECL